MPFPLIAVVALGAIGLMAAKASSGAPAASLPAPSPSPSKSNSTIATSNKAAVTPSGSLVLSPAAAATTVKAAPKVDEEREMNKSLQEAMAGALSLLTVNSYGEITGPVTADAIRTASQIAGRLDSEGFPEAAATLRSLASLAAKKVPPIPKEEEIPLPGVPDALKTQINQMLQNERDPAKLTTLVTSLKSVPQSAERDALIQTIKALIVQIESENAARRSLEAADAVMNAPLGAVEATTPKKAAPAAAVSTPKAKVVEDSSQMTPQSSPAPAPKNAAQQAAELMSSHLRSVQSKYGMPGAKGKEDKSIISNFQKKAGLTEDGKAGPGTLGKAASLGQGELPLVMYWPASTNRNGVQTYRNTLRRLAGEADAQGFTDIGNSLRMSASYEQGQGGIVQAGPALT